MLHVAEQWRTLTKSPFNQLSSLTACLIGTADPSAEGTVPWLTSGYWVEEWFPQMMTFFTSWTRMPSLLAICINQQGQLSENSPLKDMSLAEFESNSTDLQPKLLFHCFASLRFIERYQSYGLSHALIHHLNSPLCFLVHTTAFQPEVL